MENDKSFLESSFMLKAIMEKVFRVSPPEMPERKKGSSCGRSLV